MSKAPAPPHLQSLAELTPGHGRGWLVGGAVRDELLGRETLDYDVAVDGDVEGLARALARAARGHAFRLSEAFGAWRVRARDGRWQIDLTPLFGETVEQDLARRDLTINAIARPIQAGAADGAELIDPFGGVADLQARRLRMVGPESFRADPLRTVRLVRLAVELQFEVDALTAREAVTSAPKLGAVAPERVFAELCQIVSADRAVAGFELMERIGITRAVLPELIALRGVRQSDYHHLDVYDHTLAVLAEAIELERDPAPVFGASGGRVSAVLAEPLANELTRGGGMRFGALLHDIAKAATRSVGESGRVGFRGHDLVGAEMTAEILTRLRASERLIAHVAALTRHHLRLGFLVHRRPLSRRDVYAYLAACEPVEVDVTVFSVADRLATLGRNSDRAIELHLELAGEIMPDALAWRASRPRPPIRGDRLGEAVGVQPGPQLGRLLEELTVAAYANEVQGEEQAIAHARDWLAATGA
jgi:putative nucleotidyltransferase with HDIG domain